MFVLCYSVLSRAFGGDIAVTLRPDGLAVMTSLPAEVVRL